jgi:PiT family inorganic phosphate transporter
VTGCVIGAGAARRASAVRWGVAGDVVVAWVITIPAAGVVAAIFYWLISGEFMRVAIAAAIIGVLAFAARMAGTRLVASKA